VKKDLSFLKEEGRKKKVEGYFYLHPYLKEPYFYPMQIMFTFFILIAFAMQGSAQDLPAYQLFDKDGKKVKFSKMMQKLGEGDVIFFGESHNNPISHWLQLRVTKALHAEKGDNLALGAEMFESDNQLLLNEYLAGDISEKNFKDEAKLWNNYKTDYEPLVLFAKENGLPFIATNIPRRYASRVFRQGLESLNELSDEARALIAPLPVEVDLELPGYKNMMSMMGDAQHGGENFPKAQAIKDATMGHFILQNWAPGTTFLHYNGSYHSENFEGIVWYIKKGNPDVQVMTITTISQDEIDKLEDENKGKADFILCVPSDMTTTY
jgi:uncharacterized iron-regulated protein